LIEELSIKAEAALDKTGDFLLEILLPPADADDDGDVDEDDLMVFDKLFKNQ
jgi:hypothetical protein